MIRSAQNGEKDSEKPIDNEGQMTEEQLPEFDLYGTVLNEL